jgi:hypothetical protein
MNSTDVGAARRAGHDDGVIPLWRHASKASAERLVGAHLR